jgi:hypothetical protein
MTPLPPDRDDAPVSKSLLATNPYLRDPEARRAALEVSAASSSAVEGIRKPFAKRDSDTASAKNGGHRKRRAAGP